MPFNPQSINLPSGNHLVKVDGAYHRETVCFNNEASSCTTSFNLFAVTCSESLLNLQFDGILGLGIDEKSEGTLYQLFDDGIIDSLQFGLGGSQIRLGGFNKALVEKGEDLHFIETVEDWNFQISEIKAGKAVF